MQFIKHLIFFWVKQISLYFLKNLLQVTCLFFLKHAELNSFDFTEKKILFINLYTYHIFKWTVLSVNKWDHRQLGKFQKFNVISSIFSINEECITLISQSAFTSFFLDNKITKKDMLAIIYWLYIFVSRDINS